MIPYLISLRAFVVSLTDKDAKNLPNSRLEYKNHTRFMTTLAKIDTLLTTIPFRGAHTYIAHRKE